MEGFERVEVRLVPVSMVEESQLRSAAEALRNLGDLLGGEMGAKYRGYAEVVHGIEGKWRTSRAFTVDTATGTLRGG